jgi:hypothetical protein
VGNPLDVTKIPTILENLKGIPNNWDGEDAKAPNVQALESAFYVFNLLDNYKEEIYHTAPGPWGEIMFDLRDECSQRGIEIIFYENRKVYVTIDENGEMKQGDFDVQILPELLQWLHQKN